MRRIIMPIHPIKGSHEALVGYKADRSDTSKKTMQSGQEHKPAKQLPVTDTDLPERFLNLSVMTRRNDLDQRIPDADTAARIAKHTSTQIVRYKDQALRTQANNGSRAAMVLL
jgi:hypothetical protein